MIIWEFNNLKKKNLNKTSKKETLRTYWYGENNDK